MGSIYRKPLVPSGQGALNTTSVRGYRGLIIGSELACLGPGKGVSDTCLSPILFVAFKLLMSLINRARFVLHPAVECQACLIRGHLDPRVSVIFI